MVPDTMLKYLIYPDVLLPAQAFLMLSNRSQMLNAWLVVAEDEGEPIVPPTPQDELVTEPGTLYSLISADTIDYRAKTDTRAVRKNVSLPNWMVQLADKRGINCSQVLQHALRSLLDSSVVHTH